MIAVAQIRGGSLAPSLVGVVCFRDVPGGVDVSVEVRGLPKYKPASEGKPPIGPHGFHIHESGNCTMGESKNPFAAAGGHWNPTNQPHGNHAGDFPVLFSNNGYARMVFFTNKFKVSDVIGKTVIIHESPDDYRSQPAGDSGKRLGCGVIKAYNACPDPMPRMYCY
ncbi:superoxide dismutase family protein [Clostridium sp. CX1]|uniref:superoxide dismutase family protein n=1 Tax=Clostridium sp. CX1 TaxID=2978346 RepID=UPI0021BEA533|nr:superoxide dismutase family protein [Clostridium sp. CX1]MCT8975331.1 superoxide dismutase family protein [Clostridium sp. CX1]